MTQSTDLIQIEGAPPAWRLERLARRLLQRLRERRLLPRGARAVLSISCVGASEMSRLNARYRGKNRPTDVLSFEQPPGARVPRGIVFLGDLVLCREVVRAQAKEFGHGVGEELAVLLAHGLLHLLGFDHERSAREAKRMARAESALLGPRGAGLISRSKVKGSSL
jgi:rRNA maturation RNase YbeY